MKKFIVVFGGLLLFALGSCVKVQVESPVAIAQKMLKSEVPEEDKACIIYDCTTAEEISGAGDMSKKMVDEVIHGYWDQENPDKVEVSIVLRKYPKALH